MGILIASKNDIIKVSKAYFDEKFDKLEFIPGETYIPSSGKVLDFKDCAHLINVSLDMRLTAGRFASRFELTLAKKFGEKLSKLTNLKIYVCVKEFISEYLSS